MAGAHVAGTKNQEGNIRHLLQSGQDQIRLVERRAHELGMDFWVSMRMNDEHEDDVRRFGSKLSAFKRSNRRLLIGEDFPRGIGAYCDRYDYTWTWNYAMPEVRRHQLAVIQEVLANYEVDGIELDFCRGPWYFRLGEELAGLPLMNAFLRSVREAVNAASIARGRNVALAVRVRSTLEANRAVGLDVATWIGEGLVDHVTPMDPGNLDMGPDLGAFMSLAKTAGVTVAGGIEPQTTGYGRSDAQQIAAAQSFWDRGVDSIYLFNYDCHRIAGRTEAYGRAELELLQILPRPEILALRDKHYFVTRDYRTHRPDGAWRLPLPRDLALPGDSDEFSIHVGDDIEGQSPSTNLLVSFNAQPAPAELDLRLNGEALSNPELGPAGEDVPVWHYPDPPLCRGRNSLAIRRSTDPGQSPRPIRIEKIELLIRFGIDDTPGE